MRKIPATILTGFLGAGKTTLLNHLLQECVGEQIAVIVNEFGEIGIDGQLVHATDETVIELNNGCICCTVRGDLIGAVARILEGRPNINRFVVETTGLADPAPVIQSFMLDDVLRKNLVLDALVTVVDAEYIALQLEHTEAREQIAFADVILLNKSDRAHEALDAIEIRLRRLNPLAPIHAVRAAEIPSGLVLDVGAFDVPQGLNRPLSLGWETLFSGALGLFLALVFRQLPKFLLGGTGQYDLPPVLADVQAVVGDCDQVASQTEEGSDLEDAEQRVVRCNDQVVERTDLLVLVVFHRLAQQL
jgi:G3E family GTPase